jgi:hypothetical protein
LWLCIGVLRLRALRWPGGGALPALLPLRLAAMRVAPMRLAATWLAAMRLAAMWLATVWLATMWLPRSARAAVCGRDRDADELLDVAQVGGFLSVAE